MKEMWTGPGFAERHRGRMGIIGSVTTFLGVAFAIMGIIADASRLYLIGLTYLSWFYLAIASLIFAVGCWIGWGVGVYLSSREPESTGQEAQGPRDTQQGEQSPHTM
jgi:hypothetical protein